MVVRQDVIGCAICLGSAAAGQARPVDRGARGIVDVHAHLIVADYVAAAAQAGIRLPAFGSSPPPSSPPPGPSPASDSDEGVELRLGLMDEAGVRVQVLSPVLAPYLDAEEAAVHLARIQNDRQSVVARNSRGRLPGFVSLPLPHVNASLAELRRGMDVLGMAGVTMQATVLGQSIADDRFAPLFDEMNSRRAVLFLHPAVNGLMSPLIRNWGLTPSVGPLLEDITVALHLIVKNIPVRYPDIKVIVPHLGGGIATMLDRLDNQVPKYVADLSGRPSEMARSMWYDTVSHASHVGLRAAVEALGSERLISGSDFPVLLDFERYGATFDYIANAGLRDDVVAKILYDNVRALGLADVAAG